MYEELITIDWFTIAAQLLNTLLLFLVLKHFLYKPVKKMLQSRQDEVKEMYDKANEDKARAAELKTEYEVQVASAKDQAGEIIKNASQKAQHRAGEILQDAQKKAEDRLSRAAEQIETERRKAVSEARDEIAGLAISAAEQVVRQEVDRSRNEKLVLDYLDQLETPDLSKSKRT